MPVPGRHVSRVSDYNGCFQEPAALPLNDDPAGCLVPGNYTSTLDANQTMRRAHDTFRVG